MKHIHLNIVKSTNDIAREKLDKNEPVLVTADYQTNGRGRNNKSWFGNNGLNVYMSLAVSHNEDMDIKHVVTFQSIGTIAARLALAKVTGKNIFHIKYPNDVVIPQSDGSYKKIAGVIAENGFIGSQCVYSVIGIGINVDEVEFITELKSSATSLKALGFDVKVSEVTELLKFYLQELLKLNYQAVFNIWKDELHIEGKELIVTGSDDNWIVNELMDDGRLLLTNTKNKQPRIIDDGETIRYQFQTL